MAALGMDMQPASLRTELELMTEAELARHLSLPPATLFVADGRADPYFKIGRAVRFRVAEVLRALEGMRG